MKCKAWIRMDFAKARKEADRLDQIASQLKVLSKQKLEESMGRLASAWTGTNSRLFLQKEEHLQRDIDQTVKELNEIAADIRRIAQCIYDAEIRAYEIAARRNEGGSSFSRGGSFGGGGGGGSW